MVITLPTCLCKHSRPGKQENYVSDTKYLKASASLPESKTFKAPKFHHLPFCLLTIPHNPSFINDLLHLPLLSTLDCKNSREFIGDCQTVLYDCGTF